MNDQGNADQKPPEIPDTDSRQVDAATTSQNPIPAQPATQQQLRDAEQKIETQIEERMTGFERSMVRLTRYGLAVTIMTGIIFAGQLYEMISGGTQTDKLVDYASGQADSANDIAIAASDQVDAANNFADTAEDINKRISDAVVQLQASASNTRLSIEEARTTAYRELRPYVSVTDMLLAGEVDNGKPFKGVAKVKNSGRTPAVNVEVCGDVSVTPQFITDDFPCPSPMSPKNRVEETEASVVVIGSGSEGQVSSPGTTANIEPVGLLPLLTDQRLRLYFYGYINYRDTIRTNVVHHTTFCGVYGVQSKNWNACKTHNHVD